jgi:DNA polymerase-3 subunit beta
MHGDFHVHVSGQGAWFATLFVGGAPVVDLAVDGTVWVNGAVLPVPADGSGMTLADGTQVRSTVGSAAKVFYVASLGLTLRWNGVQSLDVEVPVKQEVILPRKTVLELQRLLSDADGAIEMQFANNQAKFSFDGMEFVTKLVEGKFPDYNRVIPKGHRNNLTLGRQAMLSCLQRTAILTSDKFKGVRLNLEPGTLRVASTNAEQEEAVDELDIDYGGDAIEIGFNVTYIIDVLANMGQDMVRIDLADGNSSALITIPENDNFKYVVMPMRI